MTLPQAEKAIINGIYAAVAWLILDLGFLFQEHGGRTLSVLISRPVLAVGAAIVIVCVVGLFYKSRLAAGVLFLLFVVPLVLRMTQGAIPSGMLLIFSLVLLYFLLTAVLGTFNYHQLKTGGQTDTKPD
jgi:uncharacterized membrane protein YidH (DUF202 family)